MRKILVLFSDLDIECGKAIKLQLLVVKGEKVPRGSWPWLSAIFLTTPTGLEFQCGGTLISQQHVITGNFIL